MFLDFWHDKRIYDTAYIDCFFSDIDCVYRGNMYDKDNNIIGDYSTRNSLEIEKYFGFTGFNFGE